jgi:Mg-chelatase subunit ChlD
VGDIVNVSATVENTGDKEATQVVKFTFDGSVIDQRYVTLEGGESTGVEFAVDTTGVAPGTYTHGVSTDNDSATAQITINEENGEAEANFQVTNVNAPDTTQGDTASITATVENTGDKQGTQNVSVMVEGENITTGTGAVDIVFVVDESGSMQDDIDTVISELQAFQNRLESENVNAQYAVVTTADQVVVEQEFSSNVTETRNTLETVRQNVGGSIELNYDGINRGLDLDGREDAKRVIIDLTDEDADRTDTSPTQAEIADRLNQTNTTFIAVTPSNLPVFNSSLDKRELANQTESGQWYDLLADDFGDKFSTDIAQNVIDVTEDEQTEVTLDGGESTTVTFQIATSDLPPETYDVTVSTEDDTGTTTLTVT